MARHDSVAAFARGTAIAAAMLAGVVLVSCGETEEDVPENSAPTETSAAPTTTVDTPSPSPPPVPDDWTTYKDPDGRFTLRYPAGWQVDDDSSLQPGGDLTATFWSFDPRTTSEELPPGGIKIDLYVQPPSFLDCRSMPEGATPTNLGGIDGWRYVNPNTALGNARSVRVAAFFQDSCLILTAYSMSVDTDDVTEMIFSTLAFASAPRQQ